MHWVCLGAGSSSLQVLLPGHALTRFTPGAPSPNLSVLLHREPLLPCPPHTSGPSPAQHGGDPGRGWCSRHVEVLLNYAGFWGRGACVTSFFPPRPPRGGVPRWGSFPTLPSPLCWLTGGDVAVLLIYSHYRFSRGAGGISGRRWQWGGGTPWLSRPLRPGVPPRTAPASLPAPRVAVGTAPGF